MNTWARLLVALAVTAGPATVRAAADQAAGCRQPTYECAAAAVTRGHFEAAILTLTAVIKASPRNVNALHLLGTALTAAGRPDQADERYREALRFDPAFYPAARNLGINAFNAGRMADARRHFERVLARAPSDATSHLHLAEIHYAGRRLDAALPHYRKSGSLLGGHAPWLLHFAACLLDAGQMQQAVATLGRLPGTDAVSHFEAGMLLGQAKAYREAARFFASASGGYPDPYRASYNQVLMLTRAGAFEEAIRATETLVAAGTSTAELHHLVSRAYVDTGRIPQATDALRMAVRLEPTREAAYVDLALICLTHDAYDLGLEVIDIGLGHRPASSALHLHRGVLQTMRGELTEAESAFATARRLAPADPAPIAALAMIWIETGRPDEAIEQLRDLHRQFNDPVLSYTYALAIIRSGVDPAEPGGAEAVAALGAAIAANPAFAPAHTELGRLLLRRGQIASAITSLERAVAADAKNPAALYNLALAHRQAGDRERARRLLQQLTALNADTAMTSPEQDLKQLIFGVVKEPK